MLDALVHCKMHGKNAVTASLLKHELRYLNISSLKSIWWSEMRFFLGQAWSKRHGSDVASILSRPTFSMMMTIYQVLLHQFELMFHQHSHVVVLEAFKSVRGNTRTMRQRTQRTLRLGLKGTLSGVAMKGKMMTTVEKVRMKKLISHHCDSSSPHSHTEESLRPDKHHF